MIPFLGNSQEDKTEVASDTVKKVKEKLAMDGYDEAFGARPLRREIQRQIENPLSIGILKKQFQPEIRAVYSFNFSILQFS